VVSLSFGTRFFVQSFTICSFIRVGSSSVHGIRVFGDKIIVFGQRRAKICCVKDSKLVEVYDFGTLIDWLWDVIWYRNTIVMGFAQGDIQTWQFHNNSWKSRDIITGQARCILYSLVFWTYNESVWVAGGSVFGDIIICDASDGNETARLVGHKGPVFRLSISEDKQKLCSVGDDRTVRIWQRIDSTFALCWSVFGHTARIWDCGFCGSYDTCVSVGEDNLIKFWDVNRGAEVAILEAHFGRSTWRIAARQDGLIVATGGGDASIKLWDVEREILSRKQLKSFIPIGSLELDQHHSTKKKKIDVSPIGSMNFNADANGVFIAFSDASIVLLRHDEELSVISPDDTLCVKSLSTITVGDCVVVACGADNGWSRIFKFNYKTMAITQIVKWKPCNRAICHTNLVISGTSLNLILSSVSSELLVFQSLFVPDGPKMVYKMNPEFKANKVMSTCIFKDRFIVGGDPNGNIFFGDLTTSVNHTLKSAHGDSKVACLATHNDYMYSGGHNGIVMRWEIAENDLRCVEVIRISLIMNIENLFWDCRGNLLVGGYTYHDYILWNVQERYLLIRDKCAGWRRPSAVAFTSNSIMIYYAESSKERKLRTSSTSNAVCRVGRRGTGSLFSNPSLGTNFNGRATWNVCWIPKIGCVVTGCEDGALKLSEVKDIVETESPLPDNGFTVQVLSTRTTIESIRSSCVSYNKTELNPVIITGGGKQLITCWTIDHLELSYLCEHQSYGNDDSRVLSLVAFCNDPLRGLFGHHIIVAGSSDGTLIVFEASSDLSRTKAYRDVKSDSQFHPVGVCSQLHSVRRDIKATKPVRAIALYTEDIHLIVAGRTNGQVEIWELNEEKDWSPQLLVEFQGHSMGANAVSVAEEKSNSRILVVVSGGDDQAISCSRFCLDSKSFLGPHIRLENACASAIRGISTDGVQIWACGLNQHLRVWEMIQFRNEDANQVTVNVTLSKQGESTYFKLLQDIPVDIADVSCLHRCPTPGRPTTSLVAIVGAGMKLLEI